MEYQNIKRIDDTEKALAGHKAWQRDWKEAMKDLSSTPHSKPTDINPSRDMAIDRLWHLKNDGRKLKNYQLKAIEAGTELEGIHVREVLSDCVHHGETTFKEIKPESVWADTGTNALLCVKCSNNSKKWARDDFHAEMCREHQFLTVRDL